MDPLTALLRPAASILNRSIAEVTPARELCAGLDGTLVAIRIRGTGLNVWLRVNADAIDVLDDAPDEMPDVTISGSALTLARVGASGKLDAFRDGSLDIEGDVHKAESLQKLIAFARPDLEEGLARIIGDPAAHAIGNLSRRAGRWARDARRTIGQNLGEYLQEERRDVPTRYETERFAGDVNTLRDDVERLAARIDRLDSKR